MTVVIQRERNDGRIFSGTSRPFNARCAGTRLRMTS
jgi:hypothetical protein